MAKIAKLTQEAFDEWLESRPPVIRGLAIQVPPNLLYRLKSTNHRVTIHSYEEDGTVTVNVGGRYNLVAFETNVSGVDPDDLVECDFPPEDEAIGVILNEDEANAFINAERAKLQADPLTQRWIAEGAAS